MNVFSFFSVLCFIGIDPLVSHEHKTYIDKLCEDFENYMKHKIQEAIIDKQKSEDADPLCNEILQHTVFCQLKCKSFHGRKDTVQV